MPWWRERCGILAVALAGTLLPTAPAALANGDVADQQGGPLRSALALMLEEASWLPPRARDTIARIVLAEAIEPPTLTISNSDLFASRDRLSGVQPRDASRGIGVNLERDLFGGLPLAAPPPSAELPDPGVALLPGWAASGAP